MTPTGPNYTRILPRDLFNEAKLLKCLGKITLDMHDQLEPVYPHLTIAHDSGPFQVHLLDDGHLMVNNLHFRYRGAPILFKTAYNSKRNWPLLMEADGEEYTVFKDDGSYDEDFINFLNRPQ